MLTHPLSPPSRPWLKWPGSKLRLLPQLLPLLPSGKRLIEPFVGAGAVFLATDFEGYVLGDANPDLIASWVALKERPRQFCERAASFFSPAYHSKDAYLGVRAEFNQATDTFERAVRLLYLNKFGFNGLYRVSQRGVFNVPYGNPKKLPAFPWEQLEAATQKIDRVLLLSGGFTGTIEHAGEGDVLYCDPPYMPSIRGESFSSYTAQGFGREEHERLLACCLEAARRGAKVLISNHDTPDTRRLYAGLHIKALSVRRSVSASGDSRTMAAELVAIL